MKKKKKPVKVALIGAFGKNAPTTTGRIVRTRILYRELARRYGKKNIIVVSTEVNSRLRVMTRVIAGVLRADLIFLFVSEAGIDAFCPVIGKIKQLTGKRVYNSIIGGYIPTVLNQYPDSVKAMRTFEMNWVQMPSMVPMLKSQKIPNAEYLPNAKPYKVDPGQKLYEYHPGQTIKVCTFSRVLADKGIEEAISSVVNVHNRGYNVELHIYGEVFEGYRDRFEEILEAVPPYIQYKGIVDYRENLRVLRQYYVLLFPSVYIAEGFPGTLTDAFFSGTPVIATDWNYNGQLIEEGVTGFLYDPSRPDQMAELLVKAIENPALIQEMRLHCLKEAEKYTYTKMIRQIFATVNKDTEPRS